MIHLDGGAHMHPVYPPSERGRAARRPHVIVIIPAFNEARAIGKVVGDIPSPPITEVVVVNNASTDETERNAREAGATVVGEKRKGYGWACLRGIEYARGRQPDVVVFLDGDYSDHPDEMPRVVDPIIRGEADFVIGSRILGDRDTGAMLPQALIGNRIACLAMRLIWGARYTDLGPFRAIRFGALEDLDMTDKTFGWTIEMQIKAARAGLRWKEVPVSYRRRVGVSKVTGTVSGTLKASALILWTIARYAAEDWRKPIVRDAATRSKN